MYIIIIIIIIIIDNNSLCNIFTLSLLSLSYIQIFSLGYRSQNPQSMSFFRVCFKWDV